VLAEPGAPISCLSEISEKERERSFLLSAQILPPVYINTNGFAKEDDNQRCWMERCCKYEVTESMKAAVYKAREKGLIYEWRRERWFGRRSCELTPVADLIQRQAGSEEEIKRTAIQPMKTGDSDTPGNLGYVPHTIRTQCPPPIQLPHLNRFYGSSIITRLPSSLPDRRANMIEDAITVFSQLRYKYLWVDALCILPNASLKHNQMANMDVVERNAELTVIAAASDKC
jgi:hypothetical protein